MVPSGTTTTHTGEFSGETAGAAEEEIGGPYGDGYANKSVDGSVGEAFFDGGRARVASRAYGAGGAVALLAPANATASLSAWAMGSMWLP